MAIQRSSSDVQGSEQSILNRSMDRKYDVLASVLLGEDGENLRRIAINPDGSLGANANLELVYTGDQVTKLIKTIGDKVFEKTLTYTGDQLTEISPWVESA
jgi:hypothetical protein